ncbi:unnamed protein product [Urochloa decumbens]|uniref:Uncharacterized protein n=1 Tax=Urochloa decumbens TaxID=240449 RepID=A0ABC8VZ20_9POAL
MSPTGASALKVAATALCIGLVLSSMRQPVFAQGPTPSQRQACNSTCGSACNVVAKAACPGFCGGNPPNQLLCTTCNTTANADCNTQCVPACYANPDPNA